jgi:hypothetical protein
VNPLDFLSAHQPNPPRVRRPLIRVVDEAYGGDPFMQILECGDKRYRLDEAAMIEAEERGYGEFVAAIRAR